jgi:hypothetical protein
LGTFAKARRQTLHTQQLLGQGVRRLGNCNTVLRQPDSIGATIYKLYAQHGFQRLNPPRDRGYRNTARPGRGAERSCVADSDKVIKILRVDGHQYIFAKTRKRFALLQNGECHSIGYRSRIRGPVDKGQSKQIS